MALNILLETCDMLVYIVDSTKDFSGLYQDICKYFCIFLAFCKCVLQEQKEYARHAHLNDAASDH